ncbi:hypothetical protein [Rhodococcus sp. 06-1460-1B]|uniref:hypothetical protein n=1 Tax=Rhodococcus sp. 06-1460-1B TaxID=2022501 RepID=UPI0015960559|nr:hypothetical protein [Rhodococcus sp. 06-1460-1B]
MECVDCGAVRGAEREMGVGADGRPGASTIQKKGFTCAQPNATMASWFASGVSGTRMISVMPSGARAAPYNSALAARSATPILRWSIWDPVRSMFVMP